MREALSPHPSPSSILQSRMPGRSSAMAAQARQPAISADPEGRQKRQAQARRYRCRCAERRQAADSPSEMPLGDAGLRLHTVQHKPARVSTSQANPNFFAASARAAKCTSHGTVAALARSFAAPLAVRLCGGCIERERRWRQRAEQARRRRAAQPMPRALSSLTGIFAAATPSLLFIRPQKEEGAGGLGPPLGPPLPFSNSCSRRQGDDSVTPSVRYVLCDLMSSAITFAAIGCGAPGRPGDGAVARAVGASAHQSWRRCATRRPQVLDGFTRWEAAQQVRGMTTLSVRLIDVDDRRAKAAIYGLNQTGRRPHELEEAWIVQSLVREDGLVPSRGGRASGSAQELGMPTLGTAGEAEHRSASGTGSRASDSDRRAGNRPVAGRQPIGSPGCVTAGSAQRRRAWRRGRPALGVGDGRAKIIRAGQAARSVGASRARASTRAGTPDSARGAIESASNWRSCWTGWLGSENFLDCHGWTSLTAADRLVLGPIFQRLFTRRKCVADGAADLAVEMHQR